MSPREKHLSPQPPSSLPYRQFPTFDVMAQRKHWDETTRATVESRLEPQNPQLFFTPGERATAAALCDQLLGGVIAS